MSEFEEIKANYDKFLKYCTKLNDRTEPIAALLEHFGERLLMCPASGHVDYYGAYAGGLIEHSLGVLRHAANLQKSFASAYSNESLIITSLFHDIGKLGDLTKDFFKVQKNDYFKKQGWEYEFNKDISYMSTQHRSLHLLQHFGVKLNEEEYLAILLSGEQAQEEYKHYNLKEPVLATIIQMANRIACKNTK